MVIQEKSYIHKNIYYLAGTNNLSNLHLNNQFSLARHDETRHLEVYRRFGQALLKSLQEA